MNESPVAIVTGASSGIGKATALMLAKSGYALALAGRKLQTLEATAQAIRQTVGESANTLAVPTDISDPQQVETLVACTVEHFGRLDALANVAGYAVMQPITQTTATLWRNTIDINLTGPVLLTTAAWPHLAERGGVIANVSSMASIDPFPGLGMYAASKIGLNMFTKCTASEGAAVNIRAVTIAPGAVETPMLRSTVDKQTLPTEKTLSPEEVAQVIADCITGDRAFEPGEVIVLKSPE